MFNRQSPALSLLIADIFGGCVLRLAELQMVALTMYPYFLQVEAIVLPMTHKERFDSLGIRPPKVLPFSHHALLS